MATMAVVIGELERKAKGNKALAESLGLLRSQLGRCKQILGTLASHSGQAPAESGRRIAVDDYLRKVVEEWRALRPDVTAAVSLAGTEEAPQIVADRTLTQAIINILNNAADASPESIEVRGKWDEHWLVVEVRDRGPGIAPGLAPSLGGAFVTSKSEGMGLGFYLARHAFARLGGEVSLRNRENGAGAIAQMRLPLSGLLA